MRRLEVTRTKQMEYYSDSRTELYDYLDEIHVACGPRLLNVGCAAGMDAFRLRRLGATTLHGIEPVADAANIASKRYDHVFLSTVEDWCWDGTRYHTIVFADVLEHLVDPSATLIRAQEWLDNSGRLVISIPNVRHLSVLLPLIFSGDWRYEEAGIMDSSHLRFFTLKSFERLLTDTGWKLRDFRRYGMQPLARGTSRVFPPAGSFLLSRIFMVVEKLKAGKVAG